LSEFHGFVISELEQTAALKYLYQWLHNHPKYGKLASADRFDSLYHTDVSDLICALVLLIS